MERRIIDKRKKEKFMLDDEYLNGMAKLCGWKGTIVYNSLCRHASIKQECFPSVKLMSVQHNVSRDTILRGIESLEKRKVIQIEKKRSKNTGRWLNNTYILLDKSEWDYSQVAVNDTDGVAVSDVDQVAESDTKETQELKETHDLNETNYSIYDSEFSEKNSVAYKDKKTEEKKSRIKTGKKDTVATQPKGFKPSSPSDSADPFNRKTPEGVYADYIKHCIDVGPRIIFDGNTETVVSGEHFAEVVMAIMNEIVKLNPSGKTLCYVPAQWHAIEDMVEDKEIGIDGVETAIYNINHYQDFLDEEDGDEDGIVVNEVGVNIPNIKTPVSIRNEFKKIMRYDKKRRKVEGE